MAEIVIGEKEKLHADRARLPNEALTHGKSHLSIRGKPPRVSPGRKPPAVREQPLAWNKIYQKNAANEAESEQN